jgi:XTP/dITP diphosphohydrolase
VSARKLLVASGNRGKIDELRTLLSKLGLEVIGPDELPGPVPDCVEDGGSFCENARIKAGHWHSHTGMACLADDSGLEVKALGGAPGIYSARFAGENATDRRNNDLLLKKMAGFEKQERQARFVCCLALCSKDGSIRTFSGYCNGRILNEPLGAEGFGYDPLFYYPPLKATFAQAGAREKNKVSHRARALDKLRRHLSESGL